MGPGEAMEGVKATGEAIGVTPFEMMRFVAAAGWVFAFIGWGLFVHSNRGRLSDSKESGATALTILGTLRSMGTTLETVSGLKEEVRRAVDAMGKRRTTNPGRKPGGDS